MTPARASTSMALALALWSGHPAHETAAPGRIEVRASRLPQNPLITVDSSRSLGDNVNGPSIIRVPSWVEGKARQIRDPGVFEEAGKTFLFYSICGEQGLAAAELTLR